MSSSEGGGGRTEWPQSLKDFANRVFQTCNDSNRRMVSEELRTIIFQAFQAGTINTTDWNNVQLKSLGATSSGGVGPMSSTPLTKKGKKRMLVAVGPPSPGSRGGSSSDVSVHSNGQAGSSKHRPGSSLSGFEDEDKREKRAKRFEEEKRAFVAEQEASWDDSAPGSTASLAGRLGGTSISHSLGKRGGKSRKVGWEAVSSSPGSGWTYDPSPSVGGPATRGWGSGQDAGSSFAGRSFVDESIADPNVIDWDIDTVVGLSTKLEKPYLRLTSAPDPKTVRPLPILEQTLELLKKKWREENNYAYVCDQFKSMRQDLTVQRIKNEFTVKVYEIHARIALEKGDLGEYNQCQSQLRVLYAHHNLPGSRMEFLAYRILYLLHTRNRREVNALMTELTPASKKEPAVAHALAVRLALATGNYHSFFKLWSDAPNMNAYVMDHFVERERVAALGIVAKSYRPSIPLSYLSTELAFTDIQEAHDFLKANNIAIYIDPTPAELAASAQTKMIGGGETASGGGGGGGGGRSSNKKKSAGGRGLPLEERKWDCRGALPGLLTAGEKYQKIDIKGQI